MNLRRFHDDVVASFHRVRAALAARLDNVCGLPAYRQADTYSPLDSRYGLYLLALSS